MSTGLRAVRQPNPEVMLVEQNCIVFIRSNKEAGGEFPWQQALPPEIVSPLSTSLSAVIISFCWLLQHLLVLSSVEHHRFAVDGRILACVCCNESALCINKLKVGGFSGIPLEFSCCGVSGIPIDFSCQAPSHCSRLAAAVDGFLEPRELINHVGGCRR